MFRQILFAACALAIGAVPVLAHEAQANRATLERDVRILADDNMEGREAGTPGYDLAAGYVAGRFASIGLEPGGDAGTYFQKVPLRSFRNAAAPELVLSLDSGETLLPEPYVEFYGSGSSELANGVVDAELVFVGYALDLPEHGRDDFAGVDLKGKIAVRLSGAPAFLDGEERAHYRSTAGARISERGAIGSILLWTPELEDTFAFAQAAGRSRSSVAMTWLEADGKPYRSAPNLTASAVLSTELSRALLAGEDFDYDDVVAAEATEARTMPSFAMRSRARLTFTNQLDDVTSNNVIAILPGSDPFVAAEFIVLTAHLDHIGVMRTDEKGDDEINNGAMDNATGIATLLEVARLLAADPPRRPVMFVALTAEEKGLLGSSYHAHNPGLPEGAVLAANVNLDMPILTYPFVDVNAFGAERSNTYPLVEAAVAEAGLTLSPDPNPEQGLFVRSDQYSYIEQGIPAIYLKTGTKGAGAEAQAAFLAGHYHQQSDEITLVDFEQLGRFTEVNHLIARNVADMDQRPAWKAGDFFGTIFDGPMLDADEK